MATETVGGSSRRRMSVDDGRVFAVKFLGQVRLQPEEYTKHIKACQRVIDHLASQPSRKSYRNGHGKDLVLNLGQARLDLQQATKSLPHAFSIYLAQMQAVTTGSNSKFAVLTEDATTSDATVYVFQFKNRKPSNETLLEKLREHCKANSDGTFPDSRTSSSSRPSSHTKTTAMSVASMDSATIVGGSQNNDTARQLAEALSKIAELELQLAKEKANASEADVQRLSSVLRWVSAEKEASELKTEMADMRAEMAGVAAEMAADMAQLKADANDERGEKILTELRGLKQSLDVVDNNVRALTDKDLAAKPVAESPSPPTDKAESRLAKINVRYSSSKMLDLSRKFTNGDVSMLSTAANTTVADMTTADMTASERTLQSMIEMNRPEGSDELFQLEKNQLIDIIITQRAKVTDMEVLQKKLEDMHAELMDATLQNDQLSQRVAELEAQAEERIRNLEQEKNLLADTIAGHQHTPGSADTLQPPVKTDRPPLADETFGDLDLGHNDTIEELYVNIQFDKGASGLGFSIAGGTDDRVEANDAAVYVTNIVANGSAANDGRLQVGDKILRVNHVDFGNITHDLAVKTLQKLQGDVNLLVSRLPCDSEEEGDEQPDQSVQAAAEEEPAVASPAPTPIAAEPIVKAAEQRKEAPPSPRMVQAEAESADAKGDEAQEEQQDQEQGGNIEAHATISESIVDIEFVKGPTGLGFSIAGGSDQPVDESDPGVYVTAVIDKGSASQDGRLRVGDQLLIVNGHSMENVTHAGAVQILQQTQEICKLQVARLPDSVLEYEGTNDAPHTAEELLSIEFEKGENGLGFSIAGGTDQPVDDEDPSIYVTHIIEGGVADADKRLLVGDRLIEVNGLNVLQVTHDEAVRALLRNKTGVKMIVSRPPPPVEETIEIEFVKGPGGLGFSIAGGTDDVEEDEDPGIYVTQVLPGGSADRDGRLRVDDRIIEVNHTSTEAVTHDKAVSLLQTNPDGVQMKVIRVVDAAFVNQPEEEIIDMHFEKGNFDGFGFSIAGGNNTPIEDGDPGIYVTAVAPTGAAGVDGRLMFGDKLLMVNNIDVQDVTHETAVAALKSQPQSVTLRVSRLKQPETGDGETIVQIDIPKGPDGLGFSIAGGVDDPVEDNDENVYVTNVIEGGAAYRDGRLRLGDKLLFVNGMSLSGVGHSQAVEYLKSNPSGVQLTVSRLPFESFQDVTINQTTDSERQ